MTERINVLVTPIWEPRLDADEQWNIETSIRSSPSTPHHFAAPVGMDSSYYTSAFPKSHVDYFPAHHFRDIRSYSKFMLDPSLYRHYLEYEFLTIVQTDAILLSDLTDDLREAHFDYVGAPWAQPFGVSLPSLLEPRMMGRLQLRALLARQVSVGNGGLSVRRTNAVMSVLRRFRFGLRAVTLNEDLVLAYLGALGLMRLASRDEAASLFYERDELVAPDSVEVRGFHALQRYHPDFYRRLRTNESVTRSDRAS